MWGQTDEFILSLPIPKLLGSCPLSSQDGSVSSVYLKPTYPTPSPSVQFLSQTKSRYSNLYHVPSAYPSFSLYLSQHAILTFYSIFSPSSSPTPTSSSAPRLSIPSFPPHKKNHDSQTSPLNSLLETLEDIQNFRNMPQENAPLPYPPSNLYSYSLYI